MVVCAVTFFNTGGHGEKFSAFAFGALRADLIDAYWSDAPLQTVRARGYESDVVREEEAASGRGGVVEEEHLDAFRYPTTHEDVLLSSFAPLEVDQNQVLREHIVYYILEDGDTLSEIATRFGIEQSTLVWANNLSSVDYVKAGQRLEILPVDGVKHEVKKGDSVSTVANRFRADPADIIAYNHLPADGSLREGDVLIVPDGVMPTPPRPKPTIIAGEQPQTSAPGRIDSNKYFIFPTTGRRTQGLHGNNGVDIANECGMPIYAAADGQVKVIKTTNSRARVGSAVYGGYGNHVIIVHGNGTETLYAHLKDIYVFDGQSIRQGSMIATMGGGFEEINGRVVRMEGAGHSTGCHLHFEVHGARNPLAGGR